MEVFEGIDLTKFLAVNVDLFEATNQVILATLPLPHTTRWDGHNRPAVLRIQLCPRSDILS